MNLKPLFLALIVIIGIMPVSANYSKEESLDPKGLIKGKLRDKNDGKAIEYATIALYNADSKQLITGGVTNSEGFFMVKAPNKGNYYIEIKFMGYETHVVDAIDFGNSKTVDLGIISIIPNSKELEGVNIYADQAPVSYKIDKKVVNVSQQLTAKSGTALDVLENVPSIKVDIEGNVSLRGSESFTVLIDGRPTALEASDVLQQIPSGAIENIEIITNPSAKFDPDGTSGIVNIITKKNKLNGISGIVNVNGAYATQSPNNPFSSYGGDFTLDWRNSNWHAYLGGDYAVRGRDGNMEYERLISKPGSPEYYTISEGVMLRQREGRGIKFGLDYNISPNDVLGGSYRLGYWGMQRKADRDYLKYFKSGNDTTGTVNSISESDMQMGGLYHESNLNYRHNFNGDQKHFLELQINTTRRGMDDESLSFEKSSTNDTIMDNLTNENSVSEDYRFKVDYSKPFMWGGKLEAGAQGRFNNGSEESSLTSFGIENPLYDKTTDFTHNIYAAYATFSGELGKFGWQGGLRSEYTYRKISFNGEDNIIDRPDFFPTAHFSYKAKENIELMASYTRRIERPRPWFLSPVLSFIDAQNVRVGNPNLEPEYVNSLELSTQMRMGKNFVSLDLYHRNINNKIFHNHQLYAEDSTVYIHTFSNASFENATGAELMINYNPAKWYSTNVMFDFFYQHVEGEVEGFKQENKDFSWSGRMNNTFKLNPSSRIQIDFMYRGPSVRVDGSSEGFFMTSLAYRQDFFKRKLSATVMVRDVFGSMKHDFTSYNSMGYQHTIFWGNSPVISVNLSYKINNYRQKRQRGGDSEGGMDDGGMF